MRDMPRPRPPHLHRETNRHGTTVWYVRIDKGPRIRIKEAFGTPEFDAAYRLAVTGQKPAAPKGPAVGSFSWLMERYRETQDWQRLSQATRKQREAIFRPVLEKVGAQPLTVFNRASIEASVAKKADTPFQAKNFLDAMKGLFRWALKTKHVRTDPTEGLRTERPRTDGFRVWDEADVKRFEARWPLGTRERLALDLLLYTGLRRGDVAALGRQHVRAGEITIRTAKTGQVVSLPILPELAATIAASPAGDLTFITGQGGRPFVKEAFGNWFGKACRMAGVPGSAHGLRKLGATRAANNGASEAQLEAIFGWRGGGMASLYTRAANRRRLALEAMGKLSVAEPYSRTFLSGAGRSDENAAKTKPRKQRWCGQEDSNLHWFPN